MTRHRRNLERDQGVDESSGPAVQDGQLGPVEGALVVAATAAGKVVAHDVIYLVQGQEAEGRGRAKLSDAFFSLLAVIVALTQGIVIKA